MGKLAIQICQVSDHYSVDFLEKGRVLSIILQGVYPILYIKVRLLGQVYYFSFLVFCLYSFRKAVLSQQFLALPRQPSIQTSNEVALTILTGKSHHASRKPQTNTNFADLTSLKSVQKYLKNSFSFKSFILNIV